MNKKLIKCCIFTIILTFYFLSIGILYAEDNAETKAISSSTIIPQELPLLEKSELSPLNKNSVQLLEYKLSEKVENRVISSLKKFGILFGIVITVEPLAETMNIFQK